MIRLLAVLLLAGLCLAIWLADSGPKPVATATQPNILLILADDLGNNDLASSGDPALRTPNLDRLASQGVRFTRHYADASCRPARAALLTGMHASRVGVTPNFRGVSPEIDTLPEVLRDHGYSTYHIGKWHLGDRLPSSAPDLHGFGSWFGFMSGLETRTGQVTPMGATYRNPYLRSDAGPSEKYKGHMTDLFTERAAAAIRRGAGDDRPWFINLWYYAPHTPIQPAERFGRQFPDTETGRYQALLAQLDQGVGKLLQTLEETGQLQETLIVFVSDNGATNRHRDSNAPFDGAKSEYLEGGIRTPFWIAYPGLEPAAIGAPVFISDLMPTLLGFAGAPIPPSVSGRDLAPLLRGEPIAPIATRFWEVDMPLYTSWGMMDLAAGRLVYHAADTAMAQDWDQAQQRFSARRSATAAELEGALGAYREWREGVRRVSLARSADSDGWRRYTGDSYRRTPGHGMWTLQVPVQVDSPTAVTLSQEGQFALRAQAGMLEVTLPDHRFSLTTGKAGCQLITLAAVYNWRLRKPDESAGSATLFLGDEQIYSANYAIHMENEVDLYPPLVVSAGAGEPSIHNDLVQSGQARRYGLPLDCEPADS